MLRILLFPKNFCGGKVDFQIECQRFKLSYHSRVLSKEKELYSTDCII